MLSNADLEEIEKTFMNAESKDVIKALLILAGSITILYALFY